MINKIILTGTLTLLILGMGLSPAFAGPPPPEGTLLATFDPGQRVWSATFDGTNLFGNNIGSNLIRAFQTDGTPLPGQNIAAGVVISGALSWDSGRQVFWAGSNTGGSFNVYTIATDGTATLEFNTLTALQNNGNCGFNSCNSLIDGIDYDPLTDSIWYSPDGSHINYNFDTNGNLIGTLPISVFPNDMSTECGDDFTSGIMGRGTTVYAIHHTCGAFKYDTSTNPPTKISFFPIPGQVEDAECDGVTFRSQGVDALWLGSANTIVVAYAIPLGTCGVNQIGGELLPIDTTALMLAGAQSFSWMLPVVLSGIGIGLFVVSRKSENS